MLFIFHCATAAALTFKTTTLESGNFLIAVEGEFQPKEDLTGFLQAAEQAGGRDVIVTFDSPGGNPSTAILLGRLIRAFKFTTIQSRSSECASACSLAFMGGIVRVAEPGAIGVHKSSFSDTSNITVENAISFIQQQTAETVAYMSSMGVDPAILQLSLSYESDDIRYLSKSEMEKFHITTDGIAQPQNSHETELAKPPVSPNMATSNQQPQTTALLKPLAFTVPTPRSGKVRVPKGYENLRFKETQNGPKGIRVRNGDDVHILDVKEKWYRVRVRGESGYLHHNWVKVDQFTDNRFNERYVQIKSFDNRFEAEQYIISSNLPFSAYLATNGWYAITLDRSFTSKQANEMLNELKSKGLVPDDAFVTTGNTYMVKTCCMTARP